MVTHMLWHGAALCRFSNEVPGKWPEGNQWIALDTLLRSRILSNDTAPPDTNVCIVCRDRLLDSWLDTTMLGFGAPTHPGPLTGSFAWAIAQRRPMRRAKWTKHPPVGEKHEDLARELADASWVFLRVVVESPTESRWIWLTNGRPVSLNFADYNATDWEVM